MDYRESFAQRLVSLREEENKTQQELADEIGITRQSLSLYEKAERTINIELLARIADYFKVSTDYLMGRTDIKSMDNDIKTACKVTGLSEETIKIISELPICDFNLEFPRIDTLNAIIKNDNFRRFIDNASKYLCFSRIKTESKTTIKRTIGGSAQGIDIQLSSTDKANFFLFQSSNYYTQIMNDISAKKRRNKNGKHNPQKE